MPIGCSNEDDCLSLRDGRWGRVVGVHVTHVASGVWAGVPLAAAGLASGVAGEWRFGAMPAVLWNLLAAGVLVAALAGGWFILLQAVVLRRWCRRCNLAHAGAFAGLVIVGLFAPADLPWLRLAGIAIALVGVFIALQVFFPPAPFTVAPTPDARDAVARSEEVPDAAAASTTALETSIAAQPAPSTNAVAPLLQPAPQPSATTTRSRPTPTPATTVRVAGGRVALRTDTWPTFGDPRAPQVVALMMDYLCRDCCHVHRLLLDAVDRSAGSLAALILPVPMDQQTHPSLRPPKPPYDNPRAYARLAMALHQFSPSAFLTWDRHLIHADPMPLIEGATAFAQTLVSPVDLTRALTNPLIDATLRESAMWFTTAGPMQVPKLLLPRSIVTGRIPDLAGLIKIIQKDGTPSSAPQSAGSGACLPAYRSIRSSNVWSDQRIR